MPDWPWVGDVVGGASSRSPTPNLDYRPATYWPDATGTNAALSRISGSVRRRAVRESLTGGSAPLPEELSGEQLDESVRRDWGAVHPAFMGGEYLPELEEQEVEIARIDIGSVTGDVISIRACPDGNGIVYSIRDEYETVFSYEPQSSDQPLTLGQIVGLIDGATEPGSGANGGGLVVGLWSWTFEPGTSPIELLSFVQVSSAFYPALERYYAERAASWTGR